MTTAANWYGLRLKVYLIEAWAFLTRRSALGDAHVVVSLTTHGRRLARVHTSIFSIAMGTVRPMRMILWLNHGEGGEEMTWQLRWLRKRGLEIRYADNYGPHTKYYPYVASVPAHRLPLVTADDDVLYPPDWLEGLMRAHQREPEHIHCYCARQVIMASGQLKPYMEWPHLRAAGSSPCNFALGVCGVLYPPTFLNALRDAGEAFTAFCPRADDIWLHAIALRQGVNISKIGNNRIYPVSVPFTQDDALWNENMLPTGNDAQIASTYTAEDISLLSSCESRNG